MLLPGRMALITVTSTLLVSLNIRPAVAQDVSGTESQYFAEDKARLLDLIIDDKQKQDQKHLQYDETLLSALNNVVSLSPMVDTRGKAWNGPGYMDSIELRVNSLMWLQALWQPVPKQQTALADYLTGRALDPSFASRLHDVLVNDPLLRNWAASLDDAAKLAREKIEAAKLIPYKGFSIEEQRDLLRQDDVPGHLHALRQVVDGMFSVMEPDSGLQHEAWTALQRFLKDDIAVEMEAAVKKRDDERELSAKMTDGWWYAVPARATLNKAYEHLKYLKDRLTPPGDRLRHLVFSPNQTPMALLEDPALSEYLDALDQFDDAVVMICNMPELDAGSYSGLHGAFNMSGALMRRVDARVGGRDILAVFELESIAASYVRAQRWAAYNLQADSMFNELFDDSRAVAAINALEEYQHEILHNNGVHPILWAAVDLDKNGKPEWHIGGWLEWRWLNDDDHYRLTNQNRWIDFAGRSWLLPEGTTGSHITSPRDLLTAKAKLVVVAVDNSWVMANALRNRWIKYLNEIQAHKDYPNWSGPPYDLYSKSHSH